MEPDGLVCDLPADQAGFAYRRSSLDDRVVLAATLRLARERGAALARRRRACLQARRRSQPVAARSAGCVFKNPPASAAGYLIDRAGLKGVRVGGAEVSEIHANFVVTAAGTVSGDVLRLMDLVQGRVRDRFGVELEPEIVVW
jgi:UDP-N-acetylmuramate dehydrogenase